MERALRNRMFAPMCNYYRSDLRKTGAERDWYGFDEVSELPQDIYPNRLAPVVRLKDGAPCWQAMKWGFPPPPNLGKRPVTNVRNLASPYWRGWLKPEWRCLVVATAFTEWTDARPKRMHWFALGEDEPLFAFAGIWRPFTPAAAQSDLFAPPPETQRLYALLTCEPNALIAPIHARAMPVILARAHWDDWLSAPEAAAVALQRPYPAEAMREIDGA
ncbi:MAG: SOS response-associated peptidase family protein [Hydrogenophilaceae bacterium]|nr:SOS response-associated peptidase family protein [Hydrogenophilaceae bacterium]